MDFLDPTKKRARTIRLFVGYFLVGVAITLASLVLLFMSYGYGLNRKTGQVYQNGLIFVSAHPVGADIYLNGQLNSRTDARLAVPAGEYTVELKQPGYRTWKRTFTLDGGAVEQLVYPVLFPDKLVTKELHQYDATPALATVSPDRHWLLVEVPGSLTTFDVFDLTNVKTAPVTITLPTSLLTTATGPQSLNLTEWSTDNRHVLLKHTYGSKNEYIMLDRVDPTSSFNVNALFGVEPTDVSLRDKRFDQLYIYLGQTQVLMTADVKAKQITPLLSKVIKYKPYGGSTVLYVTSDSNLPDQVGVRIWDNGKTYSLRNLPAGSDYVLDTATYSGHSYVAVAATQDTQLYIYVDPLILLKQPHPDSLLTAIVLRINHPQFLSFSDTARFIAAQNGNSFAVYDAETDRRFYYTLPYPIPADQKAAWMDGHRMVLVIDGKTFVYDYDGINRQTLSPTQPGTLPFFNSDYTGLYTLAPSTASPGKVGLTRTELKVTP